MRQVWRWLHRYLHQRSRKATYMKTLQIDSEPNWKQEQNIYVDSQKPAIGLSHSPSRISFVCPSESSSATKKYKLCQLHKQSAFSQKSNNSESEGRNDESAVLDDEGQTNTVSHIYESQPSQASSSSSHCFHIYEEIPDFYTEIPLHSMESGLRATQCSVAIQTNWPITESEDYENTRDQDNELTEGVMMLEKM